jgi:hypothetical protein
MFLTRPTLTRPSLDPAVAELQDLLNRIGSLLEVDGVFGRATERAVKEAQELARIPVTGAAAPATWDWLEAQPLPSDLLSTREVTFIAREEVGSREFYDKFAACPHCPGEVSGVTIGIGYDLRYQELRNFENDWGPELARDVLEKLRPYLGQPGGPAAAASLRTIKIPFYRAWRVFLKTTLPRYLSHTREAYPQLDGLPEGCRGALVSLVYNRGPGLNGSRRREMRAIREHLAAGKLKKVAAELTAMKRLWPGNTGLRARRDRETQLWQEGLEVAGLP